MWKVRTAEHFLQDDAERIGRLLTIGDEVVQLRAGRRVDLVDRDPVQPTRERKSIVDPDRTRRMELHVR